MDGTVSAVCRNRGHEFSKPTQESITLLAGLGVEGDAHLGTTVKHRSRVARDPSAPNLRQVHLIHSELFNELAAAGYQVRPGDLGENITTAGINLLSLPTGALLQLGEHAIVEVTGLRNPCTQIDNYQQGLLGRMVHRDEQGNVIRKTGIMGIVQAGGTVHPGDQINVVLPHPPHHRLEVV